MSWLQRFPYLVESCVLLALALGALLLFPRRTRPLAALGGVLSTPFALLSTLHVPDFWRPEFSGFQFTSAEDLIWCAAAGLNSWIIALWPLRHRVVWRWVWPQSLRRYSFVASLGLLLHWPVLQLRPGPAGAMPATLFSLVVVSVAITQWHPSGIRGLIGWPALIYTAYHWLDVRAFFYFWPQTREYWNPSAQLPFTVLGIPAYEILWAGCFGLAWPALMAFICDVRLAAPAGATPPKS